MTAQEVKDYILTQLVVPVNVVQKVINSIFKVVDYVSTSNAADIIPDWTSALTFELDGSNAGRYCTHPDTDGKERIFETKIAANINNEPPTNPAVTETAQWKEISQSASAAIPEWSAGLYGPGLIIVFHNHSIDGPGLYVLLEPVRPFNSTNIETETTALKWECISSSGAGTGIAKTYGDIAAMLADQAAQKTDFFYLVTDASADATVDAGWAVYQKLATTTAAITDYRKLSEEESLDVIIAGTPDWDDTTKGKVERSTQAEMEAVATGVSTASTTGLSDSRTGSELGLYYLLTKFLTLALTWALKQTFTSAPRFSSTTASQFLKVDASKDLVSVGSASQAEMITGTDNDKPVTAKSVEDKGSVKLRDVSNSATGTNNIDCQNQDTVHVVFTTTLTGANEITVSNAGNLQVLNVTVQVTGANIEITMPGTTRMARYHEVASGPGWNQSGKQLTVTAIGTADYFELSFKRSKSDASIFILTYDGPSRA